MSMERWGAATRWSWIVSGAAIISLMGVISCKKAAPAADSPQAQAPEPQASPGAPSAPSAPSAPHERVVGEWLIHHAPDEGFVEHTQTKARQVLYSRATGKRACLDSEDPDKQDFEYELTGALLSVVGGVVSVSVEESGFCGGAHPFASTAYATRRLEDGQPVPLEAMFDPVELDRALDADATVQVLRRGEDPEGDSCETSYMEPTRSTASWAIAGLQGDQVVVRLGLTHSIEVCRGQFKTLDLTLKAPEATLKAVKQAQQQGLLMDQLAPSKP